GGEDVHEAAYDQQKNVQEQQEEPARVDVLADPGKEQGGNFGLDQVVREAHRHTEDDQHAADDRGALDRYPAIVASGRKISVEKIFDHEGIENGHGSRLNQSGEPAEEADE